MQALRMYHVLPILIALNLFGSTVAKFTDRPVIGVFTRYNENTEENVIAASYIKWLESAGARSIPIHMDTSETELKDIFRNINGLLLPGGNNHLNDSTRYMWNLAKEANENGDHFPVWGTCLGFQFMVELESEKGVDILEIDTFDTEDVSLPLIFTDYGLHHSKMFDGHCDALREIVSTQPVTYNHHSDGITPEEFLADKGLTDMFVITSTNIDLNGRHFVSSMEALDLDKYPFYGVQWHPEKNAYEYGTVPGTDHPWANNINHHPNGIYVCAAMAEVFISEARKNEHVYLEVERFPLVWAYEMRHGIYFQQMFIIPPPTDAQANSVLTSESNADTEMGQDQSLRGSQITQAGGMTIAPMHVI